MTQDAQSDLLPRFQRAALPGGLFGFLAILLFANLDPAHPETSRMAAVAFLMAFWWIVGAMPLAATALLPLVLFPALGILSARDTAAQYINDIIFLFLGGFFVALAMERWNLHRRVALRLLLLFGVRPRRLMLGFMTATFFLSMWISNTATVMMMLPIVLSIITSIEINETSQATRRYGIGLLLGIAYAASIGGTATLIGTPPNLSLVRIYEITFPHAPHITFATWLLFAMPLALVLLAILWGLLVLNFAGPGSSLSITDDLVSEQYRNLGPVTYEQKAVFAVSVSLALLWMTRTDIVLGAVTLPGWDRFFPHPAYLSDGSVAIALSLILFLLPAHSEPGAQLMDWRTANRVPWDIILLFGGGFALAKGIATSGLAAWIAAQLQGLEGLSPLFLVLLIALCASFLTELTSNVATTEMLLPVMASLAVGLKLHPLLLMIPTTLACSYAFMLPVATPPNAVVFGTRRLEVWHMVRNGVLMNFIAVILLTFAVFTWGSIVFHLGDLSAPDWATLPVRPAP